MFYFVLFFYLQKKLIIISSYTSPVDESQNEWFENLKINLKIKFIGLPLHADFKKKPNCFYSKKCVQRFLIYKCVCSILFDLYCRRVVSLIRRYFFFVIPPLRERYCGFLLKICFHSLSLHEQTLNYISVIVWKCEI